MRIRLPGPAATVIALAAIEHFHRLRPIKLPAHSASNRSFQPCHIRPITDEGKVGKLLTAFVADFRLMQHFGHFALRVLHMMKRAWLIAVVAMGQAVRTFGADAPATGPS